MTYELDGRRPSAAASLAALSSRSARATDDSPTRNGNGQGVQTEGLAGLKTGVDECLNRLIGIEELLHDIRSSMGQVGNQKEWYTTPEVAELLGKKQYTIQERWCNQGRIVCEKDEASGKWRIPAGEVKRLLAGGGLLPKKRAT